MAYKFFLVPALAPHAAEVELNDFLRAHRVLQIDRQLRLDATCPMWLFAVEYLEPNAAAEVPSFGSRRGRIDYREVLSAEDFALFSKLRELRKELAEKAAVPIYAVCTNEQLAAIATTRPRSEAALAAIDGIGDAKTRRYAADFLAVVTAHAVAGGATAGEDAVSPVDDASAVPTSGPLRSGS